MNEEETQQQIEAYVEAHEEFMKVTADMLNGIAAEINGMESGPEKLVLWKFMSRHLTPYAEKCKFLTMLYNPQAVGGDNND